MNELIRINESDSVAVALRALTQGENVYVTGADFTITVNENIPTVGCVNDIALSLENEARNLAGPENVRAFTHPYGCSQMSDDQEDTRKILADLATHPNAGGVLMLGLGCENSGIDTIVPYMYDCSVYERLRFGAREVSRCTEC